MDDLKRGAPAQEGLPADLRYVIFDPTGNVTGLVESAVEVAAQPRVAAELMRQHPEVEQVGFVRVADAAASTAQVELRMAGGEFCGNATMCVAAWYQLFGANGGACGEPSGSGHPTTVVARVSGAAEPVEVQLVLENGGPSDGFGAGVLMPEAVAIEECLLSFEGATGRVPVVRMEGISHAVIGANSPFFGLKANAPAAERAVRKWCAELAADGLGLMFLEGEAPAWQLTPLVYVPGGDTVFWEHSCASGSAATGAYLAVQAGAPVDLSFAEPGGTLRVSCDPQRHTTWLYGHVRTVLQHQ